MHSLNIQPAEKPDYWESGSLEIHSIFRTIQGEGPLAGTPAVFVRLAGCNLQCPMCDTEYTQGRKLLSRYQLLEKIDSLMGSSKINLIVLTGGEPFRQNIIPFIDLARVESNFQIQIETNGTLFLPGPWHLKNLSIVCSPKTPKIHPEIDRWASCFKYVMDSDHVSESDGLPTDVLGTGLVPARPYMQDAIIYLQPADEGDIEKNQRNMEACIESCLKFGYRLSIQLHKLIGLP